MGRPLARALCDGQTLEVLRLCSNGEKDVCSFLYSRAARIAKEMGYSKIITYILDTESGTSLRAAGWHHEADTKGQSWNCKSRERTNSVQLSLFNDRQEKYPERNKQRWAKSL